MRQVFLIGAMILPGDPFFLAQIAATTSLGARSKRAFGEIFS
jgi:hypothetical protein